MTGPVDCLTDMLTWAYEVSLSKASMFAFDTVHPEIERWMDRLSDKYAT